MKTIRQSFKGLKPRIFLKAAEHMTKGGGSYFYGCCMRLLLLEDELPEYMPRYRMAFNDLFNPDGELVGFYMASGLDRRQTLERRILAILLCYEICKEVNRKVINRPVAKFKEGDYVRYFGEKCYVYEVAKDGTLGLERCSDGISWEMVEPNHVKLIKRNK